MPVVLTPPIGSTGPSGPGEPASAAKVSVCAVAGASVEAPSVAPPSVWSDVLVARSVADAASFSVPGSAVAAARSPGCCGPATTDRKPTAKAPVPTVSTDIAIAAAFTFFMTPPPEARSFRALRRVLTSEPPFAYGPIQRVVAAARVT
jgi:hypothetical protein